MYKTILFDLDGTLLNTLPDLNTSVNFALSRNHLPLRTLARTRRDVGNGIVRLIQRSVPENTPEEVTNQVLRDYRDHYEAHSLDQTLPYPGIPDLLKRLRAQGIKVGVVSNKQDSAVKIICAHYFSGLVDVAMGECEDRGVKKKPAPDAVIAAMKALGSDGSETVYVGDSEVDIETARNAALPCITVTWGFRDREELVAAGATDLADDVGQLSVLLGIS